MPARDGSGPRGQGAKTGRGLGDCLEPSVRGSARQYPARDRWFGRLFRRRRVRNLPRNRRRLFEQDD
jgi:hypothetical protein